MENQYKTLQQTWWLWWLPLVLINCSPEEASGCRIDRHGPASTVIRVSGDCRGRDFTGIDLSGANVSGVDWTGAVCPDGTLSRNHGNSCLEHLSPTPSEDEPDLSNNSEDIPSVDFENETIEDLSTEAGPDDLLEEDLDVLMDTIEDLDLPPHDLLEDVPPDLVERDLEEDQNLEDEDADISNEPCEEDGVCFEQCLWIEPGEREATGFSVFGGPASPWTIEGWLYLSSSRQTGQSMTVLSARLPGPNNPHLFIRALGREQVNAVQLEIAKESDGELQSLRTNNQVLPVGHWTHFSVDAQLNWYVNGNRVESSVFSPGGQGLDLNVFANGITSWKLGTHAYADPPFGAWDGTMREIRISNGQRYTDNYTPTRILQDDEQTLTVWHMGEGEGVLLHGSSSNEDMPITDPNWRMCSP